MNRKLILTILVLSVSFVYSQQTLSDHESLHTVLSQALNGNEGAQTHLAKMRAMIEMRQDNGYVSVTNINDNIKVLKTELDKDQVADDVQFALDTKRINDAITEEEKAIAQLKVTRQLWKDRITGYESELQTIEGIYQRDRAQYLERVTKQSELINVLNELIAQSTTGLLENPNVPSLEGTNISQVFAQIKEIGHGHPIEALVQMNKLFTKDDAKDLIQRFEALKNAIEQSQKIDQEKEDKNLALYVVLTNNIENVLIPQAQEQIKQINTQIKQHRARIEELKEELRKITEIYNFRKEERSRAISYTTLASSTLEAELADLVQSEITVRNV